MPRLAAPAATKLPQDMSEEEKAQAALRSPHSDESGDPTPNTRKEPNHDSVGVLVISDVKSCPAPGTTTSAMALSAVPAAM